MLTELVVQNLGVIERLVLVLDGGTTVVTGETGAGKTLIIDAIALLAGGRADPGVVRTGADEAVVEGRFVSGDEEVVVRRVVPAHGRSRAYIDGNLATASRLAELVAARVDLYAQHAQHSLLTTAGQRAALDRCAGTDLGPLEAARTELAGIEAELVDLGGDPALREREMELLRFQLAELDAAAVTDPEEDDRLAAEERALTGVTADRAAGERALALLTGEGTVADLLGEVVAALAAVQPLAEDHRRVEGLAAELVDAATELRSRVDDIVDDPERLEAVLERRQVLAAVRRRYGDGTLTGVMSRHRELAARLAELEDAGGRTAALVQRRDVVRARVAAAAAVVGARRREAAPVLARSVETELRALAMERARFEVSVSDHDPGDDVQMRFSANPGMDPTALARTASGGELARAMLALRLVALSDQETVVFDEVDAGIGGTAALAVGEALARIGAHRQVLVVTHLAQVAAAADHHVGVVKRVVNGSTTTSVEVLDGEARVVELSRMLSGRPDSTSARTHARELLARRREMVHG